jgi:hypothetical protein
MTKTLSALRRSQVVSHLSTTRARYRLTSEFGRDPVLSVQYGRQRYYAFLPSTLDAYTNPLVAKDFTYTSIVLMASEAPNEVGKISADRRTKSALTFTIPLRKQIVYEQCISSAERILFRAPALTARHIDTQPQRV